MRLPARWFEAAVLLFLFWFLPHNVQPQIDTLKLQDAQPSPDRPQEHSTSQLRTLLFTDTPFPPYLKGDVNGPARGGIAVELVREISRRLGLRAEVELVPWKRALKMAETGRSDGVTLLMHTREREEYLVFSDALFQTTDLVFYNKTALSGFEWQGFQDLKGFTIGLVSGYTYGSDFLDAVTDLGLKVEYTDSTETNFNKLYLGRIQLAVEEEHVARYLIRSHPWWSGKIGEARTPVASYTYHLALSRASEAASLISKINEIIADMKEEGAIEQILNSRN
jgi:polar amino acid transport system substrate-binding protein